MKYASGKDFLKAPQKVIAFIGLSGVGKTTATTKLSDEEWFMYNVDYRIWTHYLDDKLNDFLKEFAMQQPVLRRLLLKDAIIVRHKVEFRNLLATSVFMGMPGDLRKGGSSERDFRERMAIYAKAEITSMTDIPYFISRSLKLYGYPHFAVDASGSVCEIIDLDNPDDAVLQTLEKYCTVIYIEATSQHMKELIRRHQYDPKPIYYRSDFLDKNLPQLCRKYGVSAADSLDPSTVARYLYPRLLKHRIPRYERIASSLGYTVSMTDVMSARSGSDIIRLICDTIDKSD